MLLQHRCTVEILPSVRNASEGKTRASGRNGDQQGSEVLQRDMTRNHKVKLLTMDEPSRLSSPESSIANVGSEEI